MVIKMIIVKLDEDKAIDMLIDRLKSFWNPSQEVVELFLTMYENYIYNGCFSDIEFDPMAIVDNDYVNSCVVIKEGDEDFETVKSIYKKEGCTDVSCETIYGCIEAVNENNCTFLMRRR